MMKKASKGFTLIELMIVVAIIGILAAIAIPNFLRYQLRSRAGERRLNLEAIFKSEEALRQLESSQGYSAIALSPATNVDPGATKVPWVAADIERAQTIDWIVQGSTYGAYMADVSATFNSMSACGVTDIDANDENASDALWNPALAADGTVAVAPPDAPCGQVTGGANDYTTHGIAYAHETSPMGRPQQLSANSVF